MAVAFPDTPTPVRASLPFTGSRLLAPMEGVTDPSFRDLLLGLHEPRDLGGAFTEFIRVVDHRPVSTAVVARYLGTARFPQPVGVQLMAADPSALRESAHRVAGMGVDLLDLNFGCPAKGALRGCAGSAVLDEPARLSELVRAAVEGAAGRLPVTAKIRAGGEDADRVEELARAAEDGGASLLTIHCRTRAEGYADEVDWTRIRRAVAAVEIPVCGNGGVLHHRDLERMRAETGCAFVMVGRAALADPWIFSGRVASRSEAAAFLLRYARAMRDSRMGTEKGMVSRLKQLLRFFEAGEVVAGDDDRRAWLRETDATRILERLAELAG